ncbi:hypothetical protein ACFV5N_04415 [Streptomyces sp. NPDC059853]|uniref:hypothetical protein n=1 Tax=Streptomyces sp. NPDC059853 TaxID=3346973 RepID=UPI0036548358
MAHNPQAPQNPQQDPAGSTQMFRAFVDEEPPQRRAQQSASAGPRIGLILGVVVGVLALAGAAWIAFG